MKIAVLLLIVATAALAMGDHRHNELCGISSLSVTCGSVAR